MLPVGLRWLVARAGEWPQFELEPTMVAQAIEAVDPNERRLEAGYAGSTSDTATLTCADILTVVCGNGPPLTA
jgi:hypothetical protein